MDKSIEFGLNLELLGVEKDDEVPGLLAYAFDKNGRFLGSKILDGGAAQFAVPASLLGKTIRVLIAPALEQKVPVFTDLKRLGAYETRFSLRERLKDLRLVLSPADWRPLLWCACYITGRVVKPVTLPDGSVKYLPICHARVTICEVDRLPLIIKKLPDDVLWRLRDSLLQVPSFPPEPPEEIIGPLGPMLPSVSPLAIQAFPSALPTRLATQALTLESGDAAEHECESCKKSASSSARMEIASSAVLAQSSQLDFDLSPVKALASVLSADHLRASLVELLPVWLPRLCLLDWLEPFFRYYKHCFRTVDTDDDGRFHTLMFYPCSDKPDLYFSVEQWTGSHWQSIYHPSLRCGTHWNYSCGSQVTLVVTDAAAIACAPEETVDLPSGVSTWVMPYRVGGMPIFGNPGAGTAPNGWVKANGYVDYSAGGLGLLSNAPFGGTLGFSLGYSQDIPSAGIKYYRFSYRKLGAVVWSHMSAVVSRHYVHEVPGHLPSFPAYPLGPHTVGAQSDLFEFKPDAPPAPAATDPAGTITYWPEDDWFGDIYAALLDTTSLPGGALAAAGQYEIKVEVFNAAGTQVAVGAAFDFILPKTVTASGVTARLAEATELSANGFIFRLRIDNNPTSAAIDAPAISALSITDSCGFLRYHTTGDPVTLGFHAKHPNNQAVFGLGVVRGAVGVSAASVAGHPQVGTSPVAVQDGLPAHAYSGSATGDYAHNYSAATLLSGCENAAYAISLGVYGKATNGWGRIGYDASALRAFALAKN